MPGPVATYGDNCIRNDWLPEKSIDCRKTVKRRALTGQHPVGAQGYPSHTKDIQSGVLSEPGPEALITDLTDLDAGAVKLRVLWWTKAPKHHEMLASYDDVLSAIEQALSRVKVGDQRAA
jgi:hypothetical protein